MSYYDTIDVDIKRAKEILAKGRAEPDVRFAADRDLPALLASFVAEIERLQPAYRVAARLVGTLQARVEDLEAEVARLDEALHVVTEPSPPQLEWSMEDGEHIVRLVGLRGVHCGTAGRTREEALQRFGAALAQLGPHG